MLLMQFMCGITYQMTSILHSHPVMTHAKLQTRGISMRLQDAFDMLMCELHIRFINDINKKCTSSKSKGEHNKYRL